MGQIITKPLQQQIYNYLFNHIGKDNAVSMKDLALIFQIDERQVRTVIHEIRKSNEFEKVILSANEGYFIATASELEKYNRRLFKMGVSILQASYSNAKKAAKDGQYIMTAPDDITSFLEAYGKQEPKPKAQATTSKKWEKTPYGTWKAQFPNGFFGIHKEKGVFYSKWLNNARTYSIDLPCALTLTQAKQICESDHRFQ